MELIELPQELIKATSIGWEMEHNHSVAASPFSGVAQNQRGQLERWRFSITFQRLSRASAQRLQGFFLELEGNQNVFSMFDPAQSKPLGQVDGEPMLKATQKAGERDLLISGMKPNVICQLAAGDWIQLGNQLSKVVKTCHSNASGEMTVRVFPRLWADQPAGEKLITYQPKGLFRFLSDMPAWEITPKNNGRQYGFKLTGVQEILHNEHPLK